MTYYAYVIPATDPLVEFRETVTGIFEELHQTSAQQLPFPIATVPLAIEMELQVFPWGPLSRSLAISVYFLVSNTK